MQSFGRFVLTRAVRAALTIWLVVSVVFVILRLSGDPIVLLLSEEAPSEQVAILRARLARSALLDVLRVDYIRDNIDWTPYPLYYMDLRNYNFKVK